MDQLPPTIISSRRLMSSIVMRPTMFERSGNRRLTSASGSSQEFEELEL